MPAETNFWLNWADAFVSVFVSGLDTLQNERRHSMLFKQVNLAEMVMCLEDLINYFAQPEEDIGPLLAWILFIPSSSFFVSSFLRFCFLFPFSFFFSLFDHLFEWTKMISCIRRARREADQAASAAKPSGSVPGGRHPQFDPGRHRQDHGDHIHGSHVVPLGWWSRPQLEHHLGPSLPTLGSALFHQS